MPKIINDEKINQYHLDIDKDLIIADLLLQIAEKEKRLKDLELKVANIQGGKSNEGLLRKIFKKNAPN
ncbi:hypothetical protein PV797_07250 [Clostridiaceae bacterium M8S5]|nr:hypothetical protein PV797_07250 [Clostridiaceae bacterium M8S5]